jgi:hemerythrin superfamily protein
MDVLIVLKQDHDTIRDLFSKFESAPRMAYDKKAAIFEQIRLEVTIHSRAEEEIFYPALKAFDGEGRKLVTKALQEHKDVEQLLTQISRMNSGDEKFDDKVLALIEDVDHHIVEEEGKIFQFAKENCPAEQLDQMAIDIEKRKRALERQLAA